MKKIVALLTALLLMFSLTSVAYGAGSPQGKKEFGISVSGNVGTWPDVLHSVTEGNTYDLSVDSEMDGYVFVGWNIQGEYDVVSGDLNSSKLTILPKSDIVAKAMYTAKVDLEEGEIKVEYTHNIEGLEDGNYEIIKKGEKIELSATEDVPGYAFVKWEIVGPYEIVSGSLDDSSLVILPLGNVIVKQIFEVAEDEDIDEEEPDDSDEEEEDEGDEEEDKDDGKKPPKGDTNDSEESPPTGMALPVVGLFAALGAAVISKKLSK